MSAPLPKRARRPGPASATGPGSLRLQHAGTSDSPASISTDRRLLCVAALLAACQPQADGVHDASAPPCGPSRPDNGITRRILDRVNADRAANRLAPLSWNAQLACLAQSHTANMASTGDFSHRDLAWTIRQPTYSAYATLGENILVGPGSTTADGMENAWMSSPPHRANLLWPAYGTIGIAVGWSADGRVWATQNFGRFK